MTATSRREPMVKDMAAKEANFLDPICLSKGLNV